VYIQTVLDEHPEWRLLIRSPREDVAFEADSPHEMRRVAAVTPRAQWIVRGVVVQTGIPETAWQQMPTLGPTVQPTEQGRDLWERAVRRASRRPTAVERPPLSDDPAVAAAEARALLATGMAHPVLERAALVGEPLPDVDWVRPPTTDRYVVWVGVDPGRPPWTLADRLGIPVAWIEGTTRWPREPHVTTPWGRSTVLGTLQEGSLLLVADGIVRWSGSDRDELATILRAQEPP
jgi:hypothetical protein